MATTSCASASDGELPPTLAQESVLIQSEPMPEGSKTVKGFDWSNVHDGKVDYHALLQSYRTCGFQALNFGMAVETINEMVQFSIVITEQSNVTYPPFDLVTCP